MFSIVKNPQSHRPFWQEDSVCPAFFFFFFFLIYIYCVPYFLVGICFNLCLTADFLKFTYRDLVGGLGFWPARSFFIFPLSLCVVSAREISEESSLVAKISS